MTPAPRGRAFTLVELLVPVTIIGILLLVVIPRIGRRVLLAREGETKARLGAIRAALVLYRHDLRGPYPPSLRELTRGGRYLSVLPAAKIPGRHWDSAVETAGNSSAALTDAGGWAYVNDGSDPNFGSVWINCTHTDSKGSVWSGY